MWALFDGLMFPVEFRTGIALFNPKTHQYLCEIPQ
mgnify:CR=1 FL=1